MESSPLDLEQFKARITASQSIAQNLVASWLEGTSNSPSNQLKSSQKSAKSSNESDKAGSNKSDAWEPEKTARPLGVGLGAKPDPKGTILQRSKQEEQLYRRMTGRKPDKNWNPNLSNGNAVGKQQTNEQMNGQANGQMTGMEKGKKRKQPIRAQQEEESKFGHKPKKRKTADALNDYLKKRLQ
jgi:hypothetical protein